MKKGSIALVSFPFTDLSTTKLRPALVLHADNDFYVLAFITSQQPKEQTSLIPVQPTAANGLELPSYIQCTKLATLDISLTHGEIGVLEETHYPEINVMIEEVYRL